MKKERTTKFGRKTLLNPSLCRKICDLLADANTIATVCAACGISERSFYNWMERGEKESRGEFFQFFQSVTRARATAKIKLVEFILSAASKDWRAGAFLLERMFPSEYGRSSIAVPEPERQPSAPPVVNVTIHRGPDWEKKMALANGTD